MAWNALLVVDDAKPTVWNSNKCTAYVQNSGWEGSAATKTLAYQAVGTGYNDEIKTSCKDLTGIPGADCREMHGPFLRGTQFVKKTFDNIPTHKSIKVGVRIWANDMWQTESGPVTVEVLNGNDVLASYSLDRTDELQCDSNWNTYYNEVSTIDICKLYNEIILFFFKISLIIYIILFQLTNNRNIFILIHPTRMGAKDIYLNRENHDGLHLVEAHVLNMSH